MSSPSATVERHEWNALSDEDVVARVLAGDTPLFEILMRRYNQRLYRVARSVLRDDDEAEDVMQQAYVEAYTHLAQFAGRAKLSTWLTRIAFHEAIARWKRRRREGTSRFSPESEEDAMNRVISAEPTPEHQALQGELRGQLESAIDALPAIYRAVFVLREVEGLSTAETALCLDIREDAVKTRLHRARALLRAELYRRAGATAGSAFAFHLSRCDRVVAAVFARLATAPSDTLPH
jgi:RNA polymerase sigma-70 factor (ECF subfamily)